MDKANSNIIVITSGKGGVGKTTSTAHIGLSLARRHQSVVLEDMDMGLRNLDVTLGLEGRIVYDMLDVVRGVCKVDAALIASQQPGLWLLPAAQSGNHGELDAEVVDEMIRKLALDYDWVLIDCPAGIEKGFSNSIASAQRAIVVVTADVAAVRDAGRVVRLLEERGITDINLLINRYDKRMVKRGHMMSIEDIAIILKKEVLAVIPADNMVIKALNRGIPMGPKESTAGSCYDITARKILGDDVSLAYRREYRLRHLWSTIV